MKKIGTILLFFFTALTNFAQERDTTIWEMKIYGEDTVYSKKPTLGDLAREKGDLIKAITEFRKIFESDPADKTNTYNMACAYALRRYSDSAFYFLNLSTEQDSNVFALNDADFYFLLKDKRWEEFENIMINKVEAKYTEYKNKNLSKELWRMKIKDQAFYYHLDVAEEIGGRDNPTISALWELKHFINAENIARLEEIIEEYGWPKISLVGNSAASTVFLIIQHADIEIQKKYLPLMKEAANNDEADWSSLALLIDRVNLREGKKQIYGSQIYRNEEGVFYVKDLVDPAYVNQRRAEVGLSPIEEYVGMWGIEWDIEQKEK